MIPLISFVVVSGICSITILLFFFDKAPFLIKMSNTIPLIFKKLSWPAHTPALAIFSEFSLGMFIVMSLMGSDYQSVVLSAGFTGVLLGATPTAIANMTAVTKAHGPTPTAFIILPLIGAFFVDLTNAFVIQFFLG